MTGGSTYKVRSGDTLSGIAKRLNIRTSDLQSWNNLRARSTLKVGQTLQVASNSGNNNSSITYRVRKGDSLASIARRHGVEINDVDALELNPGQQEQQLATRLEIDVVCRQQFDT
ncbi:Membrane-bound lytic murein transglycosylase D precursor [Serratia odorifera]|uniref:Membrane-bound lytic murein transglycosylase D n=1 Tax=Serratia odorifera TaxID=618 RepID=A0A447KLN9_SEROD|nr:Membrane-bound lytic murein transglycosylase D precursor [Serratia odorifera]